MQISFFKLNRSKNVIFFAKWTGQKKYKLNIMIMTSHYFIGNKKNVFATQ